MKKPPQYGHLVFLVLDKTQKVDKNVLRLARERNDDYGRAIIELLAAAPDLRAADAQYHFLNMKDLNRPRWKGNPPTGGRPRDEVDDAMQSIFKYLENSSYGSQFTIEELNNEIDPNCTCPLPKTVKNLLLEKYGSDILITDKIPYIVCFKGTGHKIITDSWSPLKMGVAEFLYRKYGSRRLLDVISSLGYCSSYQ
ncbi:hypothetical protein JTB14_002726 [Gonioctena quinquepunctata]|nr:hypothetical protein JTB14_002726 [Gonioctena quinquepunctata]